MKTVADTAELRRLAARVGATASVGRETFNSQGAKMKLVQPTPSLPPAPAPEIALPSSPPPAPQAASADVLAMLTALGSAFVEGMRAASRPAEQVPPPSSGFAGMVAERVPVAQGPKEVGVALEKDAEFGLLRAVTVTVRGLATRFLVVRDEDSHQVARLESTDTTFVFDHDRSGTLTNVSMTNQRFA